MGELDKLGIEAVLFDTDQYGKTTTVSFEVDAGVPRIKLNIDGKAYGGETVRAVLFRYFRIPIAPHIGDPHGRRMAEHEMRAALEGSLLALEPIRWINHPYANRLARNKLLQLRIAAGLGFQLPPTRVTSDPDTIRSQFEAWDRRMIAKLVGGQIVGDKAEDQYVIFTSAISMEDLENTAGLSACPAIYQQRIEKRHELRVTVVGDDVFACLIRSQEVADARVDWRAVGIEGVPVTAHDLDPRLADKCRALLRSLNLEIGGIDLIVTPEGETVFLEINAAGQWKWIEDATELPIASAIARRLSAAGVPS